MGVWKDYGKVEKEVFPESLRDRNLTACVSRFHIGESLKQRTRRRFAHIGHGSRDSPPELCDKTRRQGVQPAPACRSRKGEGVLPGDQCANAERLDTPPS